MPQETIVELIASSLSDTTHTAQQYFDQTIQTFIATLKEHRGIELPGFGILSTNNKDFLTSNKLMDKIAQATGKDSTTALSICAIITKAIGDRLRTAKGIRLPGFGRLLFIVEKPKIIKDPSIGHNLIQPGKKRIIYYPDETTKKTLNIKALEVHLGKNFKQLLASIRQESVLVLLTSKDRFSDILQYHFTEDGWTSNVSTSVVDAVQQMENGSTYLVIVDDSVKELQRFMKHMKFSLKTAMTPIIMTRPSNYTRGDQRSVEIMPDEEIKQPFEIKKFLKLSDAELERSTEEQLLFKQEIHFRLPSTDVYVDTLIDYLEELLETSGMKEESRDATINAFREGAGNAVRHGNKGVIGKAIEITYLLDKEKVTIIIGDQGEGFDWQTVVENARSNTALQAARQSAVQGRMGGLGIKAMLRYMDKIDYNSNGAELVMSKFIT